MNQSMHFTVCLGLLAGSLAIAPTVRADIPVTSGQATGDAAFFVPGGTTPTPGTAAPVLFDAAVQTLRLVTPNGTSTNSRFIPNASQFTDTNANGLPDAGDTGRLEGQLSGVAFTSAGSPVFFQGVSAALNFTLSSFTPAYIQGGTLISPQQTGTAPLVFLPSTSVTLSSASSANFTTQTGSLNVGEFDANLTGDFIGLPGDLQLRPVSSNGNLPATLGRRIKFEFKGDNVLPGAGTDLDATDGNIAYFGPTTDFKVQSVGTPGTREFKIEGKLGVLDTVISGPFTGTQTGTLSNSAVTKYEVKGEGPGYVAFGNESVSFIGTARRDTQFKFEQGNNKLEGRSSGDVYFNVSPGGVFTTYTPTVGVNNNGTTFTPAAPVSSGGSTTVVNVNSSTFTAAASFTFINTSSYTSYVRVFNPTQLVTGSYGGDDDNDNDDDVIFGNLTYRVYAKRAVQVVVERDDAGRIIVVERERGRGRALGRKKRVISTYQVLGLPSRVFPGLVGLKQIANAPSADTDDDGGTNQTTPTPSDDDDGDDNSSNNSSTNTSDNTSTNSSENTSTNNSTNSSENTSTNNSTNSSENTSTNTSTDND